MVPKPVVAVLLLFPISKESEEARREGDRPRAVFRVVNSLSFVVSQLYWVFQRRKGYAVKDRIPPTVSIT